VASCPIIVTKDGVVVDGSLALRETKSTKMQIKIKAVKRRRVKRVQSKRGFKNLGTHHGIPSGRQMGRSYLGRRCEQPRDYD
jgi:hypothetical protein